MAIEEYPRKGQLGRGTSILSLEFKFCQRCGCSPLGSMEVHRLPRVVLGPQSPYKQGTPLPGKDKLPCQVGMQRKSGCMEPAHRRATYGLGCMPAGHRSNPPRVRWAEGEQQKGDQGVRNSFNGRAAYVLEPIFGVTMSWRLHGK